ncbi:Hypothetical protein ABZS17G119_02212 [Kosakonia cowanii]
MQTAGTLLFHNLTNLFVFNMTQLITADFTLRKLLTRLLNGVGT